MGDPLETRELVSRVGLNGHETLGRGEVCDVDETEGEGAVIKLQFVGFGV